MIPAHVRAVVGASLTAVLILGTTTMASASTDDPVTVYGAGDHCLLDLDDNVMYCAATPYELPLPDTAGRGSAGLGDPESAALASTVIGIIYRGANYTGGSLAVTVDGSCSGGGQFNYYNLGAIGWNDDIESWRSYAGCRTSIWTNTNEGGTKYGPYTDRSSLGSFANTASSIRWAA